MVLLVAGQTLGEPVSVVINLLLEVGDVGLESLHLLSVDVISDSNRGSESIDDRPELFGSWVWSGGEDILYRGGG